MNSTSGAVQAAAEPNKRQSDEVRTFLAAISTVLHETVTAFESTVARITEITVMRPGGADRDLVVALQDFDRLQQEFATLGEVLAKLSIKPDDPALIGAAVGKELMAAISIANLRDRLLHHIHVLTANIPDPAAEDVEF